LSQGHR
jgi:ribosomal biogenesis protein LAS1